MFDGLSQILILIGLAIVVVLVVAASIDRGMRKDQQSRDEKKAARRVRRR